MQVKECGGYLVGDRLVYQSQHLEEGEAERAPAAVEHPSARGQTRGSAGQQSRGGPRQPGRHAGLPTRGGESSRAKHLCLRIGDYAQNWALRSRFVTF